MSNEEIFTDTAQGTLSTYNVYDFATKTLVPRQWAYCTHEQTEDAAQVRDFGVVDKKGRKLGATCFTGTLVRRGVFLTAEQKANRYGGRGYVCDPALLGKLVYWYRPNATRNGVGFGASQQEKEFSTAAERDAAVAKYWKGAERTARKWSVVQS